MPTSRPAHRASPSTQVLSRAIRRGHHAVDGWVRSRTVERLAFADQIEAMTRAGEVTRWLDRSTRYRIALFRRAHLNGIVELFDLSAYGEARIAAEDVIDDCVRMGRPLCAVALRAHGERGRCLLWAGQPAEAIEEFELVVGAAGDPPAIEMQWALTYRYCLALALRDVENLERSSAELRALVPLMVTHHGQDSAWMVTAVTQLAKNVALGGDHATAIEMASALLPSSTRLRGPASKEAISLRSKIARWTMELGDRDLGLQEASRALIDFTSAGLSTCTEACELRFDYAASLFESGDVDYAIAQLSSLNYDLGETSWSASGFAERVRMELDAWRDAHPEGTSHTE